MSDRLLELLKAMKGDKLGYQVDRYTHSLQSATRAESDGADEETVVCALLHDLGDVIAPDNHSEVIASILRPYISEKNHWVLKHHGLFQGLWSLPIQLKQDLLLLDWPFLVRLNLALTGQSFQLGHSYLFHRYF